MAKGSQGLECAGSTQEVDSSSRGEGARRTDSLAGSWTGPDDNIGLRATLRVRKAPKADTQLCILLSVTVPSNGRGEAGWTREHRPGASVRCLAWRGQGLDVQHPVKPAGVEPVIPTLGREADGGGSKVQGHPQLLRKASLGYMRLCTPPPYTN